jgi:hypothetical protein
MSQALDKHDIKHCLEMLNEELSHLKTQGEIYLVGGAVMCLVFDARPSTVDVDAFFQPSVTIRQAAGRVAAQLGLQANWLNDAVKGYLSPTGNYSTYLDLDHLRIFTAQPGYLLAMKCLAMRLGAEFHDLDDVRYLIRALNLTAYKDAVQVIQKYYPLERFPQKTLYALQELFEVAAGRTGG